MKKIILASLIFSVSVQLSALEDKKQELQRLIKKSGAKDSRGNQFALSQEERMRKLTQIQKQNRQNKLRRQSLEKTNQEYEYNKKLLQELSGRSLKNVILGDDQLQNLLLLEEYFSDSLEQKEIINKIKSIQEELKEQWPFFYYQSEINKPEVIVLINPLDEAIKKMEIIETIVNYYFDLKSQGKPFSFNQNMQLDDFKNKLMRMITINGIIGTQANINRVTLLKKIKELRE